MASSNEEIYNGQHTECLVHILKREREVNFYSVLVNSWGLGALPSRYHRVHFRSVDWLKCEKFKRK